MRIAADFIKSWSASISSKGRSGITAPSHKYFTPDDIFDFRPPVDITNYTDGSYVVGMQGIPIEPDFLSHGRNDQIPFPATFLTPIGAILVLWGTLEMNIEELIRRLCIFNSSQNELVNGFKQKSKKLIKESNKAFHDCPFLMSYIRNTLYLCEYPYSDRNILAHGQINCILKIDVPKTPATHDHVEIKLHAIGIKKGIAVEKSFTMKELKVLFYTISQISGRLSEFLTYAKYDIEGCPPYELERLKKIQQISEQES